MKNKDTPTIIFIVSMLVYTAIAIEVIVVRNFQASGITSGIVVALLYAISISFLLVAARTKKKVWATICRIAVIGWLAFVFITSFSSVNNDATVLAVILTIVATSAMVSGALRHNEQTADN